MEAPEESRAYAYVQGRAEEEEEERRNNMHNRTCLHVHRFTYAFCGASTIGEAILDDFAAVIEMFSSIHSSFPMGHTSCFYGTSVSAINTA